MKSEEVLMISLITLVQGVLFKNKAVVLYDGTKVDSSKSNLQDLHPKHTNISPIYYQYLIRNYLKDILKMTSKEAWVVRS